MTTETNSVIRHLQKVLGSCGSASRAVCMAAQCIVIMCKAANLHELLLQAAVAAISTTLLETN